MGQQVGETIWHKLYEEGESKEECLGAWSVASSNFQIQRYKSPGRLDPT